ncbi:MAG: HAMP domain-containing histidine kinase [Alphaproteobacteria bacterium]|nr:MAG: HAMP domain-containing histidine kinase [Alphaproteobacteria bacterium]
MLVMKPLAFDALPYPPLALLPTLPRLNPGEKTSMSIANLIRTNIDSLVKDWAEHAGNHIAAAEKLPLHELEDSARNLFAAIAIDMEAHQTKAEQFQKSVGKKVPERSFISEHAIGHADHRLSQGFSLNDIVSEFRAARASVMRSWASEENVERDGHEEMVRFNEAIDEAVGISLDRFDARLSRARELFLAVLGHDMRDPLGAIMLSSQLIQTDMDLSATSARAARQLHASAFRLTHMLNDLLDFTRTRLGKTLPIEAIDGDMSQTISQVVDEMRVVYPAALIDLKASGDVHGRWDFAKLAQVASNLMGNAIQHGDPLQPITVGVNGLADQLELTVTNLGKPIPAEVQNRIFDPLTRGTHVERKGSIGLGLYISAQIAVAHRGRIDVHSDESHTTFTVSIPR